MAEPAPVVLIGAARSGTKFLRDVLDASAELAAVPYDVNYVWRFGQGQLPHDHLDPSALNPRQVRFIRKELDRQAARRKGQALLEKTVSNTLRIPFVEAVLPGARYIHLIRDGRDVTESAMRCWQTPPDWPALMKKLRAMPLANIGYLVWFGRNFVAGLRKGRQGGSIWGPRFKGVSEMARTAALSEVCAQQWAVSVETTREGLASIPPERVFEIRYEDLIKGQEALRRLVAWLDLSDGERVLERHAAQLRPAPPEQWKDLPESDKRNIIRIAGPLLQKLGYKTS